MVIIDVSLFDGLCLGQLIVSKAEGVLGNCIAIGFGISVAVSFLRFGIAVGCFSVSILWVRPVILIDYSCLVIVMMIVVLFVGRLINWLLVRISVLIAPVVVVVSLGGWCLPEFVFSMINSGVSIMEILWVLVVAHADLRVHFVRLNDWFLVILLYFVSHLSHRSAVVLSPWLGVSSIIVGLIGQIFIDLRLVDMAHICLLIVAMINDMLLNSSMAVIRVVVIVPWAFVSKI